MDSNPMYILLLACLKNCRENGTSVQESSIKVSTEKFNDETIVFYHTDCYEGRKCLKMEAEGKKISDYLIYYRKEGKKSEIVCFLELKGKKLDIAEKQIAETHEHLKALSREEIPSQHHANFKWRVCICLHSHAPSNSQRIQDRLIQKYGKENVDIKHGTKRYDIGPLLRRGLK